MIEATPSIPAAPVASPRPAVVGLGEVLWDVFPDGPRFGGAPANFACGVAALSGGRIDACMVSAVGRDVPVDLGRRAVDHLRGRGVDTACVATVDRPTGQVLVELDAAGQASYRFVDDAAWDNLAWSDALAALAGRSAAVCFGTLGQRKPASRATIRRFVAAVPAGCLRVLDVNLRPPFWDAAVVLESLALADVLKLNHEELPVVAGLLGWRGTDADLLARLVETYKLRLVALTRGADGAVLLDAAGNRSDLPASPTTVRDTVGAGDAFTAALVVGLLDGLPLPAINAWAGRVAAYVTSQSGGTPDLPDELRRR
ncbi:MAG: iolC 2 [Phycisphaerales bacterium]|nr:iolC 2 [Phycisphaerales bacterium]